ncbi:AI-2E family transporter [Tessaracoccus antarcticus]|uniref:AI-2E family transporter n=1 Tax=Tessaracoccus antarcticus TaxID=2479848 RepID=A0A3M0GMA6_9ACTN|nr:AI-2E family transporter [Tessaracoccus antarcticus]RMB62319.1 AI-2E family transporter [Tessaracoccus antarcticus]
MPSTRQRNTSMVPLPRPFRVVGAAALLIVLVYAAGWVLSQVGSMVSQVLIPMVVGVLLAALLMPVQLLLNHRLRFPRHAAAAVTVVGLFALIGGTVYFSGRSIAQGVQDVTQSLQQVLDKAENWLASGPFNVDEAQLQDLFTQGRDWLSNNTSSLSSGALNATSSAGTVLVGAFLALIVAFFLLAEGDRISSFMLMVFHEPTRTKVRETIRRAWVTLGSWARTQVVVSAVDAIGIGIGAAFLGLPFVVPMIVITFLLCFIPLFGAFLSGAMFTLVALLFQGPVAALIMIAVVIAVQQLESNALQPLLMGKAVNLHPLVVLLGVTTGTYLLGLTGALLTVPILAAVNAGYKYWVGRDPFPGLANGGSALAGSPRQLAPQRKSSKLPKPIGSVTPDWIERDRRAEAAAPSGRQEVARSEEA